MAQVVVARGWQLEVDRGPDWLFIRPRFDDQPASGSPSLAEQIWALMEQTLMHRLVLELSDVERVDSELIEQLQWLQQRIHAHEGIMRICGLSPQNVEALREHDLGGQIAHYCDREAAVMGQDRPRQPR